MSDKESINPFLQAEDYFSGYQKSIENLKNDPKLIEFDKLCFELFERNEQGKRFLQLITERYLIPSLAKPGTATYQLDVLWGEGFKEFGRMLLTSVRAHQQRILAGTK
jgi:hypothetical protein